MYKLAAIGDIHLTTETINRKNIDKSIIAKLQFVVAKCLEEKVDALLLTGDIFDNVNKYIPSTVIKNIAGLFKRLPQVFYVLGNHDRHKALNLDKEDEPVAILAELSGNMIDIDNRTVIAGNYNLIGRQWQKTYDLGSTEGLECPQELNPRQTLMLTHSYLLPKQYNVAGQFLEYESLKNPCWMYIVGHYHNRIGIIKKELGNIIVPGSFTRIKTNETHNPVMYIINLPSEQITEIEIPCEPIEKVFEDVATEKQINQLKKGISEFVLSLKADKEIFTKEVFMEVYSELVNNMTPKDEEKSRKIIGYTQNILDRELIN